MKQHVIEEAVRIRMEWSMEEFLDEVRRMEQGAHALIHELEEANGEDAVQLKSGIIYEVVNDKHAGWMLRASALIDLSDEVTVA